jgi:hypothetical protein
MKTLLVALATTGLLITAWPQASEAGKKGYRSHNKSKASRSYRYKRRYSRRDYDRLPISVTRPPNTGHYTFQGHPLWAARAFQPPWNR